MSYSASIACCSHRELKIEAIKTHNLLRACPNPSLRIGYVVGDALISRSRNRAATTFLKETDDEMLCFLDDDIEINPKDLVTMMNEVHEKKYPILGGIYALKSQENPGFAFLAQEDKGTVKMGASGGIVPVRRVSTGCMIIRREVLERMIKKETAHMCRQGYYTFFQHREIEEKGILSNSYDDASEDWWFCHQALKIGVQVFADTRWRINHVGPFAYNWDFVALNGEFKKHNDILFKFDSGRKPEALVGAI